MKFLLLILLGIAFTQATSDCPHESWLKFSKKGNLTEYYMANPLIPEYLRRHLSEENGKLPEMSEQCFRHLTEWTSQLLNPREYTEIQPWALEMVDSWSKIPSGILRGNLAGTGDFDECRDVKAQIAFENAEEIFRGQYCSIFAIPQSVLEESSRNSSRKTVSIPELLEMMKDYKGFSILFPQLAICLPSSCSNDDITQYLFHIFKNQPFIPSLNFCVPGGDRELSVGALNMIVVFSTLASICVLAAIVELILINYEKNKMKSLEKSNLPQHENVKDLASKYSLAIRILLAFSLYSNTKRLMDTTPSGNNLGCIHGIRFLSICWVVIGHSWSMAKHIQTIWNQNDVRFVHENHWTINTIFSGTLSVDTFFAMSGLLVAYNLLNILEERRGSFKLHMFYIHRYLRLTPMYALLIGFMATILPHLVDGPKRLKLEQNAEMCRKYWWQNLLYIQTLVGFKKGDYMCEGEAWYISLDMQFFFISPIFIYALWRWQKFGISLLSLATVGSIVTSTLVIAQNNLTPTVLVHSLQSEYQKNFYIRPWTRIGPYLIGIWGGFLISKSKKKSNFNLSWPMALGGWALSSTIALIIIYAPYRWHDPNVQIGAIEAWIYGGFHRTIWGGIIVWVIFACLNGRGGIINEFLSWKVFMPLGRLTFAIYLVSLQVQNAINIEKGKLPTIYSNFNMVNNFFSEMTLSTLIAFICTLTMESPFMKLEKIAFG